MKIKFIIYKQINIINLILFLKYLYKNVAKKKNRLKIDIYKFYHLSSCKSNKEFSINSTFLSFLNIFLIDL